MQIHSKKNHKADKKMQTSSTKSAKKAMDIVILNFLKDVKPDGSSVLQAWVQWPFQAPLRLPQRNKGAKKIPSCLLCLQSVK
jgi:hypothetical protein